MKKEKKINILIGVMILLTVSISFAAFFNLENTVDNTILTDVTLEGDNTTHLSISSVAPYDALVFYAPMDMNISQSIVYDYTRYNNDCNITNATFYKESGYIGGAFEFDGRGDYLDCGTNSSVTTKNMTVAAWIYVKGNSAGSAGTIIGKEVTSGKSFSFEFTNGGGSDRKIRCVQLGLSDTDHYSTQLITENTWVHVACSYNATHRAIYINGTLDSSEATTGTISFSADSLKIGYGSLSGGGANFFNGTIDEAMLFNTSIEAPGILALYNNQSAKFVSSGTLNYNNTNISEDSPAFANFSLNNFSIFAGTNFSIRVDSNAPLNFSDGIVTQYSLSGIVDLSKADIIIGFQPDENRFLTPITWGNLTIVTGGVGGDSFPIVTLNSSDAITFLTNTFSLNCSATDNADGGLVNLSIYHNMGGTFGINQTVIIDNNDIYNFSQFDFTNVSDGSYVWNCQAFDNASQGAFATANKTITVAVNTVDNGTITMLFPPTKKIYSVYNASDAVKGEIYISGTYTDTITEIEANFNNQGWVTINSSLSDNIFSGRLNATPGNGTLEIRSVNNNTITDSVNSIGMGFLFVIYGQSNAEGRGVTTNSLTNTEILATMYRQDDAWAILDDPTDSSTALGSIWVGVGDWIITNTSIPYAVITASAGGSNITRWQKGVDLYDTMYTQVREATNGTMRVSGGFFYHGESDINDGRSYAEYKTLLNDSANSFKDDMSDSVGLLVGQVHRANGARAATDNIRKAQQDLWDEDNYIIRGAVMHDVDLSADNLHYTTDDEVRTFKDRWTAVVAKEILGVTTETSPIITNASVYTNKRNDTIIITLNREDLSISYWNLTASSIARGWRVELADGSILNDSNVTATTINGETINITFNTNITDGSNLTFASYLDTYKYPIIRGDGQFNLSLQTYYNQPISLTLSPKISQTLSLSFSPSNNVNNGTQTTVTGSGNRTTGALYRDGVLVSNPDINILPIGTYNYMFNASGDDDWETTNITGTLTVSELTFSTPSSSGGGRRSNRFCIFEGTLCQTDSQCCINMQCVNNRCKYPSSPIRNTIDTIKNTAKDFIDSAVDILDTINPFYNKTDDNLNVTAYNTNENNSIIKPLIIGAIIVIIIFFIICLFVFLKKNK